MSFITKLLGLKEHSYAYKFVGLSLIALLLAIIGFWGSTIGLFGHGLSNFNIQDEFGDVCTYVNGPDDLAGVEDLTIVDNNVFYFAHPYRRVFSNKSSLSRLASHLNLNPTKYNTVPMLLPVLPEEYRIPRIFVTDLIETGFPQVDIQEVQIEGFDLAIYHEFYPLGADSYIDAVNKKKYINVVFMNRVGHHIAQFEVGEITAKEKQPQGKDEKATTTASKFNTKVKLVLKNVTTSSLWTVPNSVAMVSEKEFYVTNFLTKSPVEDEFGAVLELMLLKRQGAVLHCATEFDILPLNPLGYEMVSENLRPVGQVPEVIETVSPFNTKTQQNPSLFCYPLISNIGQTNGIAVHLQHKQLVVTGGLARSIAVFELGTHDFLQTIPVPVGVDNLKFDFFDTNDLYYGLNPSMLAIGKLIQDPTAKAPNAIYRLKAESVQYNKKELLEKQEAAAKAKEDGESVDNISISTDNNKNTDIANMDLSHLDNIDQRNTQYNEKQHQMKENQKQENEQKESKDSTDETALDWFHYFLPTPLPVYIDTEPVSKQTAPTALPIPKRFTSGKVKGMPEYKWFISGSIYDQGVEVCRVVNTQ